MVLLLDRITLKCIRSFGKLFVGRRLSPRFKIGGFGSYRGT